MKKILTTVLIGMSMISFAQSNDSELSQNHLTENGYEFNWNTPADTSISTDEYNCIDNIKIYNPNRIHSGDVYTYSTQNNALILHVNGGAAPWNIIRPFEKCEPFLLDLSQFENPVIQYRVKTDADLKYLGLHYMHIDADEKLEDEFIITKDFTPITVIDGWIEGSFEIVNEGFLTGVAIHPNVETELPHDPEIANIEFDYIKIVEGATPIITNVINTKNEVMSIYPNPASGIVNIQLDKKDLTVSVLNSLGQEVKSVLVEATEIVLDISFLETGLYFLQIKDEEGILQVERLVVK